MNIDSFKNARQELYNQRKMYTITCSDCGKSAQVPFEPKENRPVFCRDCYGKHKVAR